MGTSKPKSPTAWSSTRTMDAQCSAQTQQTAAVMDPTLIQCQCSIKGARLANEDASASFQSSNGFAVSFVCDGHGGRDLASFFAFQFEREMREAAERLGECDVTPVALVSSLRTAFHSAVAAVDAEASFGNQGTTLSAVLLHLKTMVMATLQLGDGLILAAQPSTGKILEVPVLYAMDDGCAQEGTAAGATSAMCISTSHDFTNHREMARYQKALWKAGLDLHVQKRRDAPAAENRVRAQVTGRGRAVLHDLVEPSRAVEDLSHYPASMQDGPLIRLQREPEFVVWQLPARDAAVFVGCDGFMSKHAIPTPARLAAMICNPGDFLSGAFLNGTVLEGWLASKSWWDAGFEKPGSEGWSGDPLRHTRRLLHHIAPDREWKEAVDDSYTRIADARARHGNTIPCLLDNPHAAVSVSASIPVLLGSDDNVTLEAMVVA